MPALHAAYARFVRRLQPLLDLLADAFDVTVRLYVAQVFLISGLIKLTDFGATRALFADEYRVPLLAPDAAAVLGTTGEIVLPVLLAVGLATRFAAAGLALVNALAVVSYWHVLRDLEPALAQHAYWAALLLVPLLYGPRRASLDGWLSRAPAGRPDPRAFTA